MISVSASPAEAFGAYLHVPFCARRCDYCAFATWDDRGHLLDGYVLGLAAEVRAAAPSTRPATSVFLGGGTPSLLTPTQLASVLLELPTAPGAEITIECNPDTLDEEKLAGYRAAGVTRISLGVQSMVPHVLAILGRTHDPANVERSAAAIRDVGFESWNLDLIYGSVGESMTDWRRTLEQALALEPPHVSAYGLTVEAGTPLAADAARHPDDDDQAEKYEMAEALLAAAGLANYEVSNWARPGHECRHNRLYWSQGDYRGFGCAAHSHAGGRRWWNVRTPERYLSLVAAGEPVEAAGEELDPDERLLEGLQLALRMREGVAASALPDLEDLEGLVERRGDRAVLTLRGRLLANEVALRLRPPQPTNAAAAAANDAATQAIDLDEFYDSGEVVLDGDRAEAVAEASVAAKGLDHLEPVVERVEIDGTSVTVVVRGRASHLFARAVPGGKDHVDVTTSSEAEAEELP